MKPAQDLIRRIRKRDLYRNTHDILVPRDKAELYEAISEEAIVQFKPAISNLQSRDIFVHKLTLNYGMSLQVTW